MRGACVQALVLALWFCSLAHGETQSIMRLPLQQWQLHRGDDARCLAGNDPGCTWTDMSAARVNPNYLFDSYYRISVPLPAAFKSAPQLGLLVEGFEPVYEVFVGGKRAGGSGSFTTHIGPQYARQIVSFPSSLAEGGRLQITIHSLGLLTAIPVGRFSPALGRPEDLEEFRNVETLRYLAASWEHYLAWLTTMGAGLMFFLLFAVNTRLKEYFWLGAKLATIPVLRIMEFASVVNLSVPDWMALAVYCVGNGLLVVFAIEFAFAFLSRPVPRIWRVVELAGLAAIPRLLLLLPLAPRTIDSMAWVLTSPLLNNVFIGSLAVAAFAALVMLPVCFQSGLPEMRWIGVATVALILVEFNRQLGNFRLPSVPEQFAVGTLELDVRPLVYLVFAVLMLVSMTFRFRRIQDHGRQIQQELAAARSVQQILIPDVPEHVEGLTIESVYLPAQEVGGDFFQVVPVKASGDPGGPEQPCAFVVLGDVSGKGLKAAMIVSLLVGALRSFAETTTSPAELLSGLNRRLIGRMRGFTTCVALAIYPSGKVILSNAGHLDPYVGGVPLETEHNLPLGILEETIYTERPFHLNTNQKLTLMTDGIVEAANADTDELFGFERTLAVSEHRASEIARAASTFALGAPQADDMTVLTITRSC